MKRAPVFRSALQARLSAASRQAFDARRRMESETRRLYGTQRWRNLAAGQLITEPLCRMCDANGRIEAAIVCDHVTPHRGDVEAFWAGPFQSLCTHCHSSLKQREEAGPHSR